VGLWLGVCFLIAFVTGVYSHLAQDAPGWFPELTRPVWLYRVTQGVHVASGTAAVPLLLVKLWSVYPRLFERPPVEAWARLARHGAERLSIGVLVAGSVFQLATGLANSAQWYPWGFSFRATHYAVGWITIGALLVHVAVKLPLIMSALRARLDADPESTGSAAATGIGPHDVAPPSAAVVTTAQAATPLQPGLTRRGLLGVTAAAAGVAVVTTAGAAVPALRDISVFGVRSGAGPGGIPINKSARAADVVAAALDPAFRLTIAGPGGTMRLSVTDLELLPQVEAELPIACVEGWSASGRWQGPTVASLLALVGAPAPSTVTVTSLQREGAFRVTELPPGFAADPLTLLAVGLEGEPLSLDHGYPCRLIAPNRPGVLQTKWVQRLEVSA
jgi:DMSO/TMAO reductase YedYZ molybdopterin-dependent catalytic subunit